MIRQKDVEPRLSSRFARLECEKRRDAFRANQLAADHQARRTDRRADRREGGLSALGSFRDVVTEDELLEELADEASLHEFEPSVEYDD